MRGFLKNHESPGFDSVISGIPAAKRADFERGGSFRPLGSVVGSYALCETERGLASVPWAFRVKGSPATGEIEMEIR